MKALYYLYRIVLGIIFLIVAPPFVLIAAPRVITYTFRNRCNGWSQVDIRRARQSLDTGPFIWLHKMLIMHGDGSSQTFNGVRG